MGGTSQGNSDLIQGGQGFARAFMEAQNYRRQRALQDAQLAEKMGNLDTAEQAYGRVFPGFHFPSITIPGQEATSPQPVENQATPSGEGGTEGGPGRGAPAYTPGQQAQPPITTKYDPSQGLTFAQLVAGDREMANDPDVRRMLPAFGNRPAHEVVALDQGLRHTTIDPLTGMQTTTGGLFPNVGGKMQMRGNVAARAKMMEDEIIRLHGLVDPSNPQSSAGFDNAVNTASQWRNQVLTQDPALASLIPDFAQIGKGLQGSITASRGRFMLQNADRDIATAGENLRQAQAQYNPADPASRDRVMSAFTAYQQAIANQKGAAKLAGVQPQLAGSLNPQQLTDQFTRSRQPRQVGQPVTVTGRNGTYAYTQFEVPDPTTGKPTARFAVTDPRTGKLLYWDDKMPGENSMPQVNVNVTAPNTPTGEPIDDGAGNMWQQMRNPKTGKLEYRATSGPHQGTWSNEPRMPGPSAPHGGDMKGWSDAQLQDFLTNPATSKGQITDHNQAEAELKRRGYVQDAKGAWSKKDGQDHPNRTFASKGTHRIYTDDGGKTWFDASTNEPVR